MRRRHCLFGPLARVFIGLVATNSIAQENLPLRNLLVEVRQVQSSEADTRGLDPALAQPLQQRSSRSDTRAQQQALVLNGRAVRLGLGTQTPLRVWSSYLRAGQVLLLPGTALLESRTGFWAQPRWDGGEWVELSLFAELANPAMAANAQARSTVVLPLQQWTAVGESSTASDESQQQFGLPLQQRRQGQWVLEVRVSVR
ncbi:MAG: hypothetical protein ACT4NV_19490 [Rhodoferax sp.]